MMKFGGMIFLILAGLWGTAELSFAQNGRNEIAIDKNAYLQPGPKIDKGTLITIAGWQADTKSYEVKVLAEEAVGPLYTPFETLVRATNVPSVETLARDPKSIVGKDFVLSGDLQIMSDDEYEKRKASIAEMKKKLKVKSPGR